MIQLRNHTYYFRQTIPKRLQPIVSTREIYYSLRTKDRSIAELKVAQVLPLVMNLKRMAVTPKLDRNAVNRLIEHFHKQLGPLDNLEPHELDGEISYLDDCMEELALNLADPATNQTSPRTYKDGNGSDLSQNLLSELGYSEVSDRTRFEADKALHAACDQRKQTTINALYGTSTQQEQPQQVSHLISPPPPTTSTSPRVNDLAKSFIQKKKDEQRLTAGTITEYQSKLRDLVELTGDKPKQILTLMKQTGLETP